MGSITTFPITTKKISELTALTAGQVDQANDLLEVTDVSASSSKKVTILNLLNIAGAPLGTTDTQTVQNKTLDNTNTVTVKDTIFTLQDDSDASKQARFQLSGITTATTRTYTLPNASSTLADISTAQTLTNKTLTAPTITGGTVDNTTITVDSIAGHTTSNTGTIYGVSITSGQITGASSVAPAALATGVQTSKFSNQYKFSAYRNGAVNSVTSPTLITFDTVTFDTNSNYSTSTGKFTAPITGFYNFTAQLQITNNASNYVFASLYKNGAEVKRGVQFNIGTTITVGFNVVGLLSLAAGDFVQVFGQGSGAAYTVASSIFCYFEGFLVSAT